MLKEICVGNGDSCLDLDPVGKYFRGALDKMSSPKFTLQNGKNQLLPEVVSYGKWPN